ncbi:hypothetical protein BDZ89DRAFT_504031 [Hymenopellis radicata]|nr:hypothetical protein BDZ89DRAFT_504031 [Hymenopellis radicata]
MSDSDSDTIIQSRYRDDAHQLKLAAAATNYLEFAQVAPYEDLISPYVKMWLDANTNVYDNDCHMFWPHGGDASSPGIVWKKLFDGVPIDLCQKPSLPLRYWGQVKER